MKYIGSSILITGLMFIAEVATAQTPEVNDLFATPYPGMMRIENYSAEFEYESLKFATEPEKDGQAVNTKTETGALAHTLYQSLADVNVSPLKVFKNYTTALKKGGFDILLACGNDQCGSTSFLYNLHGQSSLWRYFQSYEPGVYISFFYISASKIIDGKPVYVSMIVYRYGEGETFVVQDVLISEPVENGLVEVDLDFSTMETQGSIVLQGLFFPMGEDRLLPTSEKSLNNIADFLERNNQQKFYVVGHTDNDGAHDFNMNLSLRRAETVTNALIDNFGISANQLLPIGNGATSPIIANDGVNAKAKNRRVELVER